MASEDLKGLLEKIYNQEINPDFAERELLNLIKKTRTPRKLTAKIREFELSFSEKVFTLYSLLKKIKETYNLEKPLDLIEEIESLDNPEIIFQTISVLIKSITDVKSELYLSCHNKRVNGELLYSKIEQHLQKTANDFTSSPLTLKEITLEEI
jgi:hypothetical protein